MKNLTGKHLAGQCLYLCVSASPVSPFSPVSPSPGPCSVIKMQRQSQVAILQYLKRFIDPVHIAQLPLASSILLSFSLTVSLSLSTLLHTLFPCCVAVQRAASGDASWLHSLCNAVYPPSPPLFLLLTLSLSVTFLVCLVSRSGT